MAYVIDASPTGVAGSTYEAAIDWGDGSPSTGGTIVLATPDAFAVVGSHVYAAAGSYPVRVFVVKVDTGDSTSTSGLAGVSATPPLSFVVTNTNDSGPGSLRQVILNADIVGGHAITFAIPTLGVDTIVIDSPLPMITGPTVIDGSSQAAFEGTTSSGPLIEVDGQLAGSGGVDGLTFGANSAGSLLFDVSAFEFSGAQVMIEAADVTLFGDILGLRADGSAPAVPRRGCPAASFANSGVEIVAPGAVIGGTAPGQRDLISGNSGYGILVAGAPASMIRISDNLIGVDPTGFVARPNLLDGIAVVNWREPRGHRSLERDLGQPRQRDRDPGRLRRPDHRITPSAPTSRQRFRQIGNGEDGIDIDQGASSILIGGPSPVVVQQYLRQRLGGRGHPGGVRPAS